MWLDNASDIDILFYEPYARIIADIAKNKEYNPLTIGVFGLWGAGKSTLLKLIDKKLENEMDLAYSLVKLGRSARNSANIKNRQPLSKMLISVDTLPE